MKKTVRYYLADPTKNYTILVDTPVPPERQPALASSLMREEPLAEQVGFLSQMRPDSVCLRMAGGEFCGNAAMSAAAVCAAGTGQTAVDISVRVLQVDVCVPVHVRKNADGSFTGTVTMPRPLSIETHMLPEGGMLPVVTFPGIAHVIVETPMDKTQAERLAPVWCKALRTQAIGIMQFDCTGSRLTPLVYVPSADTLYWENACASGTAALGYRIAAKTGTPTKAVIEQPGGSLEIAVSADGILRLTGTVDIVRQGEFTV